MKLRSAGRCDCGAWCEEGTEVSMRIEYNRWTITGCPACSDACGRRRVGLVKSDPRPECQEGNLAARIRRQRAKRARR